MEAGAIRVVAILDTSDYDKGSEKLAKQNKRLKDSTSKASTQQKAFNANLLNLTKKGLKAATVATSAFAATVLGMAIKGGISRLLNIEDAESKLRGLGHSAKNVDKIMENALASVKGTAFGLDAAATTAANAVAAGIKPGKELEQVLTTVSNSASLAGVDMDAMGAIFNKVAATGKLTGRELQQLGQQGIPVLQFLGDELGVTSEKVAEMASKGQIDFAKFEKAMRTGVGDAAFEMGKTTRGVWSNLKAALSRLGVEIVKGPIEHVKGGMIGATKFIDDWGKTAIDSIKDTISSIAGVGKTVASTIKSGDMRSLGEILGKSIAKAVDLAVAGIRVTTDKLRDWFKGIDWGKVGLDIGKKAIAFVVGLVAGLLDADWGAAWDVLKDNWLPILIGVFTFVFAPSRLIGVIGKLFKKLPFSGVLSKYILAPIRGLFAPIREAFATIFSMGGGVISKFGSRVSAIFNTFKMMLITPFKLAIEWIAARILTIPVAFNRVWLIIKGIFSITASWFSRVFRSVFTVIKSALQPVGEFFMLLWNSIKAPFLAANAWFRSKFLSAATGIKNVFTPIVQFFSGIWSKIRGVFASVNVWIRDKFQAAFNGIKSVFGGVATWFRNNVVNKIVGVFSNVGNSIRSKFSGIWSGVAGTLKGMINSVLRLPLTTPQIKVGGKVLLGSKTIIPALAKGAVVTAPTLAMIGEGNEPEAVIPLSKLDKMLEGNGGGGGLNIGTINISNEVDGERWIKRLTGDQEVIANNMTPVQSWGGYYG